MPVILSRNGVLLGKGGGGSGVNYTAGKNIDITDGVISTDGTIYFDTNEGEKIVVRDLTGAAIGEIILGSGGVGDRAYFHSYDLAHHQYQFTIDSKGFVLKDTDGNEVTLNGEDLVINGHSFIELFNKVDSIDPTKIHEYTGVAPITVDNTNDTISIDDSDYVKQGELDEALEGKQDKLRAGDHIEITSDNLISVTGTLGKVYEAGDQYINVDNENDRISLNIETIATKGDLEYLATKEELNNYYTKEETYNQTEIDDKDTVVNNRITTEVNNINEKLDGLHNTEVASTNGTVTINTTTGADGTKYFDLSVAGGGGTTVHLFNSWNFLSYMLPNKSDISSNVEYPSTLLAFNNPSYGTFTLPPNATCMLTIETEDDSTLTWTRLNDVESSKFGFSILLNFDKVDASWESGSCYWSIPVLAGAQTSYTSQCRPTTFYFKTKDEAVNSWELLKFSQDGLAYMGPGIGRVSFANNRLIIRGLYWV